MSSAVRSARRSKAVGPAVRNFTICGLLAAGTVQMHGSDPARSLSSSVLVTRSDTRDPHDPGPVDFVEPAPLLASDWTPRALEGLSLATLEYVVTNASAAPMSLTATLLWDAGTTEGGTAVVDRFVVAAGQRRVRRVDPTLIPAVVRGERYPGLIQLSLASRDGATVVLPAFFVMPLGSDEFPPAAAWPHELMDAARLEAATREIPFPDQEGGVAVRIIEWRPSTARVVDENGG